MEIHIDPHTLERAQERGAHEEEIRDVIRSGVPIQAKRGRLGKAKVYDFQQMRLNKFRSYWSTVRDLHLSDSTPT